MVQLPMTLNEAGGHFCRYKTLAILVTGWGTIAFLINLFTHILENARDERFCVHVTFPIRSWLLWNFMYSYIKLWSCEVLKISLHYHKSSELNVYCKYSVICNHTSVGTNEKQLLKRMIDLQNWWQSRQCSCWLPFEWIDCREWMQHRSFTDSVRPTSSSPYPVRSRNSSTCIIIGVDNFKDIILHGRPNPT